ncbi:MAG: sulfatase [Armatimonadetes bacterium]|nr:sulfatase [Armatimonadota bacterium]
MSSTRLNVVWIYGEDTTAHFGCYGERTITTPRVDQMAAEGVVFRQAFCTGPVCSASRSGVITGSYQTAVGAHHHRSGRGVEPVHLPAGVEPLPLLLQRAGYWTSLQAEPVGDGRLGKTDYNFVWPRAMFDGTELGQRPDDRPFFAQITLWGGKHRESATWHDRARVALGSLTDPESVELPPYYPRDPVFLADWADYLDTVRYTDLQVGQILDRLDNEGLADNTVVIFLADHGISQARGKQFLYDEGTKVPFVVRAPDFRAGVVRDDLVQTMDAAAITLAAAGVAPPAWMQARNCLAADYEPREVTFAARDRCDETVDRIRSVRSRRYKYIRNCLPKRPLLQPCAYKDDKRILHRLRELHAAGGLDEHQSALFAPRRKPEELYDLVADPWELHNLATEPDHAEVLVEMRDRLDRWVMESPDLGAEPEPLRRYDSDMAAYLHEVRGRPDYCAAVRANIEQQKVWRAEGI